MVAFAWSVRTTPHGSTSAWWTPGFGIPADRRGAIFEPFVQLHRSLAQPAEGTGLGLAISRDLARGMGGELSVESEPGAGSTFTLALDRAI